MRHEEQKHIFDELKHQLLRLYADRNDQRAKRLADKILQDVRDSNLGELTDTWEQNCIAHPELKEFNPYKLIRRFEDAIKPPDPKPSSTPTRSMTATEQYQPAGSRSFPIDLRELRHVVGQGLHSLAKRKSMADNSLATIDGIFNAVEEMVKTRQRHRAISLIMQRKATIAEWKRELANPGSTRRPSPKGKGHKRADSGLSVSQYRSVPRLTNGSRSSDNGEGSSRRQEVERPQGRPQASSSSPGQQVDKRDGGSKGKGKGKERVQPAELSSVSTRRQRADNTAASTSTPARQIIPSAATRAGISNHKSSQNGVDGVNGINGLGSLQVDFGNGEDSWRHGDDSWRLGGP
ncbi:hypothetical protein BR93DRAFT_931789 [Coniochaeta sp. PMI_546]|nr:hypothetical protein BR93DRAFT_931789 [Coniochaeta sp. PMI_546]